ncbi:hypothetical protein [Alkaliphilus peptidifermentans]|uniref:Uncharacterized protein n=1 Tax=Alkaliphilus peptidifermentans DSM 18978 TaxID=1120976 RepID=A0A1G5HSD3_9FIRM|nr:hypothetical protein [Alkaliphilus peptidifermentans]SCY66663.1 hypothetical protein SAMN03080606_02112 [Alkaliphilus peptidifermentans DSM 18978]
MTTLEAIIRLNEIKETLENKHLNYEHFNSLCQEFHSIKNQLLKSNFAFDNIKILITEVEKAINLVKIA